MKKPPLKHHDKLDSLHLEHDGFYERLESRLVQRQLKPGDVFIDVGAHIGYYSVMAAEMVGPTGKVLSFEPEIENFALLKLNMLAYQNCMQYRVALSDSAGSLNLFISSENSGDHRLVPIEGRERQEVDVKRLDDCTEKLARVDFIKIDVQGSEIRVLRGAEKTIAKGGDDLKLLIEYGPSYLDAAGASGGMLAGMLLDMGFFIYTPQDGEWVYADSRALYARTWKHRNLFCFRQPAEKIEWGE